MARSRVKLNSAGVKDVFRQWARGEGLETGRRVASAMNATAPVGETGELSRSHTAWVEENPTRPVVRAGSDLDYAAAIMIGTGYAARALDSA